MKKSKLNLIIDGLLLLCIAAIAGIGFLTKYILVPGYRRWETYGRNVDLFFWSMDRHEWGTIHLVIGFVFLSLLGLHIVLHLDMIIRIYRKLIPNAALRVVIALFLVCLTILLFTFGFFVKPEMEERGWGKGRGQASAGVIRLPAKSAKRRGGQALWRASVGKTAPTTGVGAKQILHSVQNDNGVGPPNDRRISASVLRPFGATEDRSLRRGHT